MREIDIDDTEFEAALKVIRKGIPPETFSQVEPTIRRARQMQRGPRQEPEEDKTVIFDRLSLPQQKKLFQYIQSTKQLSLKGQKGNITYIKNLIPNLNLYFCFPERSIFKS